MFRRFWLGYTFVVNRVIEGDWLFAMLAIECWTGTKMQGAVDFGPLFLGATVVRVA